MTDISSAAASTSLPLCSVQDSLPKWSPSEPKPSPGWETRQRWGSDNEQEQGWKPSLESYYVSRLQPDGNSMNRSPADVVFSIDCVSEVCSTSWVFLMWDCHRGRLSPQCEKSAWAFEDYAIYPASCGERLLVLGAEQRRAQAQLEVRIIAPDYGQHPKSKQGWRSCCV